MNLDNWKLLTDITFKTQSYRKNFDLVFEKDSFITEHDGTISHVKLSERKPPVLVGEYGFSVWNVGMGLKYGMNLDRLIDEHQFETTYIELKELIRNNLFSFKEYNKVVLIHSLVVKGDYRKIGITEEFVETMYRDFYDKNNAIIALVKPFQNNPVDADYYFNNKTVPIRENLSDTIKIEKVPAMEYYSLNDFIIKRDTELNEYKLFALASKCGFSRIGESCLFMFSPEKIVERMEEKQKGFEMIKIF